MNDQKRLLLVEDGSDYQLLLKSLFESNGYAVDCANNGQEALNKLREGSSEPDLILLDVMMPIMDGREFRRHQLMDPELAEIPVVVMTAHGDKQLRITLAGAKDFLEKPTDFDHLLKVVERICRQ